MLLAGTGICAALHAREVTGEGQWVEDLAGPGRPMWASQIRYRAEYEPANFATVPYHGPGHGVRMRGRDWVHLMVVRNSNQVMYDLLEVAPEGRDIPGRGRRSRSVTNAASTSSGVQTIAPRQVLALLQPAEVPVVPVQPARDAYTTPQLVHNGMVVEVDDPEEGPIRMIGIPYRLEKNTSAVQGPATPVGRAHRRGAR